MKHLLASCAVVALMAAPALAQSTTPPNDPFADANVIVDPATPEQPDVSVDAEVQSETEMSVTMAPETDVDAESDAVAETETETGVTEEPEMSAETETEVTPDVDMTAETETEEASDPIFQAQSEETDSSTVAAEAEMTADVEAAEVPVDVADLPEEYSTEDLNAMMLAQLNDKADEIASITFVSDTQTFASSDTATDVAAEETYASTETETYAAEETDPSIAPQSDMAMTETAPAEDYASTETDTAAPTGSNTYASSETEAEVATESYAGTDIETDATPQSDLAMTDTVPSENATTQDYASSATGTYERPETDMATPDLAPSDEAAIEDYAANEAGTMPDELPVSPEAEATMVPVAPALEDDATEMAEETDDTITMADQSDTSAVVAQGDIDQNAVEIATGDARFSTLVELVGIAGLEDALSQTGSYTVFAPTNEAFAALPEETLTRLKSEEGKEELAEILKAHVVEGAVMASDVPLAGQEVQTLADTKANVTGSIDGSLNINGSNTIGDGIYASNGVVYAVDAVILPEATPEPMVDDTGN